MPTHPCERPDETLLRDCRIETYRASGPGGQKRNKTSSAVRITHVPTGLHTVAVESRSQHDNRRQALARLRLILATDIRRENPTDTPPWWPNITDSAGRIRVGRRSEFFIPTIAHVFDVLDANSASLADAAKHLGTTTANLGELLASDPHVWAAAQRLRQLHGHKPLLNPGK